MTLLLEFLDVQHLANQELCCKEKRLQLLHLYLIKMLDSVDKLEEFLKILD